MAEGRTDSDGVKMTPMMQQYLSMRRQLPDDVLLLFRLGDFYEMFFEDAKIAAPILGVALTKRNGMPMCGVPHHAAEGYMAKLIREGSASLSRSRRPNRNRGKSSSGKSARSSAPGRLTI